MKQNSIPEPSLIPPEPDPPILYCDMCGEGIYEGDHYHHYADGTNYCNGCEEDNYGRVAH